MTIPPIQPPPPYLPPPVGYAEPRVRPGSVTAVAILGIVFGAMGLLCIGVGTIYSVMAQSGAMQQRQAMQMQQSPQMLAFGYTTGAIGFVLSLILLLGSIAALSLRPWARKLLIGYAVADLMYNTIKLFLAMVWMMPEITRQMEHMPTQQGMDPKQLAKYARWSMLVTNWGVYVVLVTFAIIVLAVMTRPAVKAAFEPEAGAPALPPVA